MGEQVRPSVAKAKEALTYVGNAKLDTLACVYGGSSVAHRSPVVKILRLAALQCALVNHALCD